MHTTTAHTTHYGPHSDRPPSCPRRENSAYATHVRDWRQGSAKKFWPYIDMDESWQEKAAV